MLRHVNACERMPVRRSLCVRDGAFCQWRESDGSADVS